jgi:hypothetical protein
VQLRIKELKGDEFTINFDPTETVGSFKSRIEGISKIPALEIKLLLNGKVLNDEKTLGGTNELFFVI